ncbi:hypothetical protein ACFQ14_16655 [Pseudahrensia aquimaris]|uniref:Uncharacterized protein n=1 Tax=Pseudahrensia aquimaris TaxID=744461 RepID=A0ABW3FM06_9HYPH
MRRALLFSGAILALFLGPATAQSLEVREDLNWIEGIYATPDGCAKMKARVAAGEPRSFANAVSYLTKDGFTDGWEGSCDFHAVFVRGDFATAQSICQEGASVSFTQFLFSREQVDSERADIYVFYDESSNADPATIQPEGELHRWCEVHPQ